jgi:monoamine oxidase
MSRAASELSDPFSYSPDHYLTCLKTWSDNPNPQPKDIAIIGAGMAGLTAAWLLKRKGHRVRIFEAKHVVGGRIKTLRERFTSGFYAEAGAMRIPSHHILTYHFLDLFKLPLLDFANSCDNGLIFVNNTPTTFAKYPHNPNFFHLMDHERGKTAECIFNRVVENYIKRVHGIDISIHMLSGRGPPS